MPNGVRVSEMKVIRYEGGDLYDVLANLMRQRLSGRLTLNLSQGGIGSIEWSLSKYESTQNCVDRNS